MAQQQPELVEQVRAELDRVAKEHEQALKQAEAALQAERAERARAEQQYEDLRNRTVPTPDHLRELRKYRDSLEGDIANFSRKANLSRNYSNVLQWVTIVGSVVTAALTGAGAASATAQTPRLIAAGTSGLVSIAAGAAGFFKFRERGSNEKMTADAIERHAQAARLSLGEYAAPKTEEERLRLLATNIEMIKTEQRQRELQLDQKSEDRGRATAQAGS